MSTSKDLHYMLLCSELEGNDSFNMECWKDHKYYFDTEDEMLKYINGQLFIHVISVFKFEKLDSDIFHKNDFF